MWKPRSTRYNSDGPIFSDAGIPVVLFMEDYDIDRQDSNGWRLAVAGACMWDRFSNLSRTGWKTCPTTPGRRAATSNRKPLYHDSDDTMQNIDLDYGAALTAIVIESVARATQRA